jgi:hypothetical protein
LGSRKQNHAEDKVVQRRTSSLRTSLDQATTSVRSGEIINVILLRIVEVEGFCETVGRLAVIGLTFKAIP